jgi:hypothetical protein
MRRAKSKSARSALVCFAAAFLLWQVTLAGLIERAWPDVRDPEWHLLVERLRHRQAEAAGRPLVVVLGSSRSEMAIDAARLSRSPSGPVVFNASVPAGGPLLQKVLLDRLLAEGIRPDRVAIEVMPPYFSEVGACHEEGSPAWQRLTLAELLDLVPQAREPSRLLKPWLRARLLPLSAHHPSLQRRLLPAKLCPAGDVTGSDRDGHGWRPGTPECLARRAELTQFMLAQYDRALRSPVLFEPRLRRLGELLVRCRQEGIGCVMFLSPENSEFRSRPTASFRQALDTALTRLAGEHGVRLHDARTWLSDEEFVDGHHVTTGGAIRFTTRFEKHLLNQRARQGVLATTAPRWQ